MKPNFFLKIFKKCIYKIIKKLKNSKIIKCLTKVK